MLRDKAVHQIGPMSYKFESFAFCAGIVDEALLRKPQEKVNGKNI